MATISFSSSPLTTSFPQFSFEQSPDYGSFSNISLDGLNPSFDQTNLFGFNASQDFLNKTQPIVDQITFKTGLTTQNSSDPATAFKGKQLTQSVVNKVAGQKKGPSFSDKFQNSTFGQNFGAWNAGLNIANDLFTGIVGQKDEYSGAEGQLTQTLDSGYDSLQNIASQFGPIGQVVSLGMGANKLLGNIANKLGGGTDGMCVCAGTKVYTTSGQLVNIEDLKQEDGIIGWSEITKEIKPQTISHLIEPRQKECLQITLENGEILKCSIDHPILSDISPKAKMKTIKGKRIGIRQWEFRRADELKVGNFVGIANNVDYWGVQEMPKAYLVGLLIGDGSYGRGQSCRIISADPDTWKYIEDNHLGVINHCDDSRPDKYTKEVRTYRIIDGMSLMRDLGIVYQSGKDKTLPKNIYKYDKNSICKLIAGLYDTDGSISVNEEKQQYSITLYQSNILLLQEVKQQLYKLGIFSTINTRKAAKYQIGGKIINSNESYRLSIGDIRSIRKFYQLIPLNISYKKENLYRIVQMLQSKSPKEHNNISGAKQVKIVAINNIGIQTVYNLQADNDHTYLANNIITHNTTQDAILGSAFFQLTPFGLINGFGGKNADTITKNEQAFETVGSSYGGTASAVNDALQKSGKKYGLFSRGALSDANAEIAEARRQQEVMSDIADEATDRFDIRNSMSAINGNRRSYYLRGGYNQADVRVGKSGMSIELINKAKNIIKAKDGTKVQQSDPFEYYLSTLPDNQKHSDDYRIRDYWEFNGKPKDFEEAKQRGMFTFNKSDNSWHARSFQENPNTGNLEFMKSANHPTTHMETDWYEKGYKYNDDGTYTILQPGSPEYNDWQNFRSMYDLDKSGPYYIYVKKQQKAQEFKEGGTVTEIELTIPKDTDMFKNGGQFETEIELTIPEDIQEFKEGGAVNVIPEGALHARKHNMDMEGITKKGIPVVSDGSNGEVEQQAEIERSEIIFRKSVTEKLEELEKKFYSDDSSQKEKDEYALEAGKLLVKEILYNTIDNTNELL